MPSNDPAATRLFKTPNSLGIAIMIVALPVVFTACSRQDMFDQPRDKPLAEDANFPDGRSARVLVTGTIPRGDGERMGNGDDTAAPAKLTPALLQRGRQRFEIYCAPCHGRTGDGEGMAVRMGFPPPPSYFSDRVKLATDVHLYSVISEGYGQMYGYGYRLAPADRWAVVAYIRVLQLSRDIDWKDLSESERSTLRAPSGEGPL